MPPGTRNFLLFEDPRLEALASANDATHPHQIQEAACTDHRVRCVARLIARRLRGFAAPAR
jgi:hypothetical protein